MGAISRRSPTLLVLVACLLAGAFSTTASAETPIPVNEEIELLLPRSNSGGLRALDNGVAIIATDNDSQLDEYNVIDAASGKELWNWTGSFGGIADDTVYLQSGRQALAVELSTGLIRWEFASDEPIQLVFSPGLWPQTIFASGEQAFFALNAVTGLDQWSVPTAQLERSGETCGIDPQGTVDESVVVVLLPCGGYGYQLISLDAATGTEQWRQSIDSVFGIDLQGATPAELLVSTGSTFLGVNATTGEIDWTQQGTIYGRFDGLAILGSTYPNPFVKVVDESNGNVLLLSAGEAPLAYDASLLVTWKKDGTLVARDLPGLEHRWQTSATGNAIAVEAALGSRTFNVIATNSLGQSESMVRSLDRSTGAVLWQQTVAGRLFDGPYVAGSAVIVLSSEELTALEQATGSIRWSFHYPESPLFDYPYRRVEAIADGIVYDRSNSVVTARDITTGATLWSRAAGGAKPLVEPRQPATPEIAVARSEPSEHGRRWLVPIALAAIALTVILAAFFRSLRHSRYDAPSNLPNVERGHRHG